MKNTKTKFKKRRKKEPLSPPIFPSLSLLLPPFSLSPCLPSPLFSPCLNPASQRPLGVLVALPVELVQLLGVGRNQRQEEAAQVDHGHFQRLVEGRREPLGLVVVVHRAHVELPGEGVDGEGVGALQRHVVGHAAVEVPGEGAGDLEIF